MVEADDWPPVHEPPCVWCARLVAAVPRSEPIALHLGCEEQLAQRDPDAVARFKAAAAAGRYEDARDALRPLARR